jgi:cytochrome c553
MPNQLYPLKQSLRNGIALTSLILAGSACSYRDLQSGGGETARPANRQQSIPGYITVREAVFVPNCIRCHGNSGNINLETYSAAVSALEHINHSVVVEKTMPPNKKLTDDQIELVKAWVDAGGPENDQPAPGASSSPGASASPSPAPSPSASPDLD